MKRRGIAASVVAVVLILIVVLLLVTRCGRGSTEAVSDPIVGDWNVTYGAPSVVTISGSATGYTMTAKTAVRVTGSACDLPATTVIARFSRADNGTFTGQHGLWSTASCAFAQWTDVTLVLDSDRHLSETIGKGVEKHDLTRH